MSAEDIKVNDMVYVAKPTPCCNDTAFLYFVGTVVEIAPDARTVCRTCGALTTASVSLLDNRLMMLTECLKKFDPKSQPVDDPTELNTPIKDAVKVIRELVR